MIDRYSEIKYFFEIISKLQKKKRRKQTIFNRIPYIKEDSYANRVPSV